MLDPAHHPAAALVPARAPQVDPAPLVPAAPGRRALDHLPPPALRALQAPAAGVMTTADAPAHRKTSC